MTHVHAKQKLKMALVSLMIQKRFESITITDLINVANVNRSTYYYHYYKKEEILEEITNQCIYDLIEAIKLPYQDVDELTINENILPSSINLFKHVYQRKDYYRALLNYENGLTFQRELLKVLTFFFGNETSPVYSNKAKIKEQSIYTDMHPTFHAYGILGMITKWVNDDCRQSPTLMAKQLTNILFYKYDKIRLNFQ